MFFDVFPTLEVNGDMKKLLSETEVTKVGMNHEKDHIRIYLNGTRLIHKKNIYQLEKNIHDQIFKNRHMDVKVIEKYQLSEQYTAEKLMDLYKDSILEELKNYSLMEYNLLRSAKMEFTGDSHLLLTLENTIIAQTRSHEIVEFLEKVVCERCGLDLSVELAFEGFRFMDLCRWMLLDKSPYTLKTKIEFDRVPTASYNKEHPEENEIMNLKEVVLVERKYTDRHYWLPLPKADVYLYEGFGQNPGW